MIILKTSQILKTFENEKPSILTQTELHKKNELKYRTEVRGSMLVLESVERLSKSVEKME